MSRTTASSGMSLSSQADDFVAQVFDGGEEWPTLGVQTQTSGTGSAGPATPAHEKELNPPPSAPPSPTETQGNSIRRHKSYYFENDQVIFLAEDTLFNVHRSILMRHSAVFRDMFEMPPPTGQPVEGLTDQHPIRLENVKALDFECLLSILYPPMIGKYTAMLPEWISILQLATRWLFDDIRTLAINELTKFDIEPVQKVAIATQCDIPDWLHTSYMALCDRQNPLTVDEARRLGVDVVAKLAAAREIYRDHRYRFKRDVDLSNIISEMFGTTPPQPEDKPPALVLKYHSQFELK